jgi:hypothetical protein
MTDVSDEHYLEKLVPLEKRLSFLLNVMLQSQDIKEQVT